MPEKENDSQRNKRVLIAALMGADCVLALRLQEMERVITSEEVGRLNPEKYDCLGREYRTLQYIVAPFIRRELDTPL